MDERAARPVLAGALLAGAVLLLAAPAPGHALSALRSPALDAPFAPLVAVVAGAAWLAAAWLLLGCAVVLGGRLPGRAGRALRALARRVLPRALRTLLEVALGTGLAVGALTAPAAAAPSTAPPLDHPLATPGLDWPTGHAGPAVEPHSPDGSPGLTAVAATPPTPVAPATPAARPATTPATTPAATPATTPALVVVAPGDSLWDLAARDLVRRGASAAPPAVAAAWPAWWAANRAVVGDDPDLLLPGTRLVPPASR